MGNFISLNTNSDETKTQEQRDLESATFESATFERYKSEVSNNTLECLNLSDGYYNSTTNPLIRLNATFISQLLDLIPAQGCKLTIIELGRYPLDTTLVQALLGAIKKCPLLRGLYLAKCDMNATHIATLAPALANLTSLTNLFLQENSIGDLGATKLAEALKYKSSLYTLNLSNNSIGDTGATAVASMVATCSSIGHVYLAHNQIGASGIEAFIKTAKIRELSWLSLDDNPGFTPEKQDELKVIKSNYPARAQVLALYTSDNAAQPTPVANPLERFLARDGDHAIMGGRVLRFLLQPKPAALPPPPAAGANPERAIRLPVDDEIMRPRGHGF
jgi:hypothetical protein